eukprot:171850-Chlamydomonas_euryale.AAC.5
MVYDTSSSSWRMRTCSRSHGQGRCIPPAEGGGGVRKLVPQCNQAALSGASSTYWTSRIPVKAVRRRPSITNHAPHAPQYAELVPNTTRVKKSSSTQQRGKLTTRAPITPVYSPLPVFRHRNDCPVGSVNSSDSSRRSTPRLTQCSRAQSPGPVAWAGAALASMLATAVAGVARLSMPAAARAGSACSSMPAFVGGPAKGIDPGGSAAAWQSAGPAAAACTTLPSPALLTPAASPTLLLLSMRRRACSGAHVPACPDGSAACSAGRAAAGVLGAGNATSTADMAAAAAEADRHPCLSAAAMLMGRRRDDSDARSVGANRRSLSHAQAG